MLKSPIHRPEEEREFEQFTTETGRLFFRRPAKQSPLQRNIFEFSPRDLSLTPQT